MEKKGSAVQNLPSSEILEGKISTVQSAKPPISYIPDHPIYRRPLPDTCIPFASEEGKIIFKEALLAGYMNCYFRLASQFRTQDEPAYCGLATLVMVLNALEIDPGRVWKGPWKWYHEDMLDCCVPVSRVQREGITFDQFICLANCNSVDTRATRVTPASSLPHFRRLVEEMTRLEERFLVLSYSRAALEQTGDGHFAPVSGYHPERDLVLILDTARFKYPPHWVPLSLLFRAMQSLDPSTGLSRGYIQVWYAQDSKSLLLFKISEQFSVNATPDIVDKYRPFLLSWLRVLAAPYQAQNNCVDAIVRQSIQGLIKTVSYLTSEVVVLSTQEHVSCSDSCKVQCVLRDLLTDLEATRVFAIVQDHALALPASDLAKLQKIFSGEIGSRKTCHGVDLRLCLGHFVTAFLLSWPYKLSLEQGTLGCSLQELAANEKSRAQGAFLCDEMSTLQRQLNKLAGFHCPALVKQGDCCNSSKVVDPPVDSSAVV